MIGSAKSTFGFDPRTIPGCSLWLDAADATTVTGTTSVTAWRDKSINGYVANSFVNSVANPSWVSNVQNGNGVIQYTAGNGSSIANFVLAQTMSIFKVYYPINQSTGSPFIEHGPNENSESGFYFHAQSGNNFAINSGTGQIYVNFGTTSVSNTWQMIEGINPDPANGNTMAFYVNGTTRASGSTQSGTTTVTKTLYINGRAGTSSVSYNTYLAELIIYNIAVTTAQRQQIEGYLAHKWGLTAYYLPRTPLTIPGCTIWLDGEDPAGTGTSPSAGTLATWVDKSGNGRNGIQYSTLARPTFVTNSLNSRGGVSFSAASSNCYQTATILPTPRALFVVGFSSNDGFILSGIPTPNSGHPPYYATFARDVEFGVNNTSDAAHSGNVASTANVNYILTGLYTGSNVTAIMNGGTLSNTVAFSGTPKTPATTLIGINSYAGTLGAPLSGTINEFIAFNTDLTTTQRQTIEGYLARKWGFTSMYPSIPSTHPFLSLKPHLRVFQPTDISGCQLWLDAADSSTVTGTTSVTQWRDKSGNGRNTTTTGTVSYANSGISITTSSSYLTGSFGSPDYTGTTVSCFIVASMSSSSGTVGRLLGLGKVGTQDGDGLASIAMGRGNGLVVRTYRTIPTSSPPSIPAYDTRFIATWGQTSSLLFNSINGGALTTASLSGAFAINAYRIGNDLLPDDVNEQLNGTINEIVVYFSELTTSQRQQVEGYLAHKWGLVPSYPTNIPLSIPGCQLWLDAADSSSLVLSGSSVTTWNDKSGNGYHMNTLTATATWSGGATYPTIGTSINGRRTVNFSPQAGLRQSTTLDGVKNLFWVGRIAAPTGSGGGSAYFLLGTATDTTSGYDWHAEAYGGKFLDPLNSQSGIRNATASLITSDPNAVTNATFSSVNMPSAPNVSLLSVTGITGFTRYQGICFDRVYHIGWCGDLAEVLIYTIPLTSTQRQQIEVYLSQKWGLIQSGQFSSTHPFSRIPPASVVFSPLSISGLALWLDAADQSSMTLSGSSVTQWRDKSGIGNHALANTGTVTTNSTRINGLNTIRFSTSSFLTISSFAMVANVSMFAVLRGVTAQGSGNFGYFFIGMGLQPSFFVYTLQPSFGNIAGPYSAWVASTGETNWYMPSSDFFLNNPGFIYTDNSTSFVNGSQLTRNPNRASVPNTVSAATYNNLQIGGRVQADSLAFDFAELLFYNNTLTTTQRQQVEGYLAQKWGLTGSLPSTHPFKKIPA